MKPVSKRTARIHSTPIDIGTPASVLSRQTHTTGHQEAEGTPASPLQAGCRAIPSLRRTCLRATSALVNIAHGPLPSHRQKSLVGASDTASRDVSVAGCVSRSQSCCLGRLSCQGGGCSAAVPHFMERHINPSDEKKLTR